MSAEIVTLHPRNDAPIQPIPFGKRPRRQIENLAGCLEGIKDALTRPEDLAQQDRIKRAARAARDVADGKASVCPSLFRAKAGHAEGLAHALRQLASECNALGAYKQAATFNGVADFVETASAELEALA